MRISSKLLFLSRVVDYCLLYLFCLVLLYTTPFFIEGFYSVLLAIGIPMLWLPVGAFFLRFFGKTPGLLLFGLSIKQGDGEHLGWKKAFWQALLPYQDSKHAVVVFSAGGSFRRLFAVLISFFVIFSAIEKQEISFISSNVKNSLVQKGWQEYTHPEEGFTIQFPTDPSESSQSIGGVGRPLNITEVVSEKKKIRYSLSYVHLPKKWMLAGENTILKVGMDLLLQHVAAQKLISKQMGTHENHKTIDFNYLSESSEVYSRLVIVDGTLYKLSVEYPKGDLDKKMVASFFASFVPKVS